METICAWFLWFMAYSVFGWVYEVIIRLYLDHRFVNRGFLNGPYCPIYGTGAVLVLLTLGNLTDPIQIFIMGAVLTCTLEYLTSYVMEKLFHARWWDYSNMKFNLHGRVCLLGAVAFGAFSALLVLVIHPIVSGWISLIPDITATALSVIMAVGFVIDLVITVVNLSSFGKKVEELSKSLGKSRENVALKLHTHHDVLKKHLNYQQRRFIIAFPNIKIKSENRLLENLRSALINKRGTKELKSLRL